jgi:precorrin-6Y C5,15-methyltransferase (decarboxylating)
MTKAPVRAQVLSALQLTPHAVLYDVGAGTGSVSIAAARCIPEGQVYAIEKNAEGLALIEQNRLKLQADNVIAVDAFAPEVPELPQPPTHAFIGGSSGNLKEIIVWLKGLNPDCRIVMTAVTLETVSRVLESCRQLELEEPEMVQIQATRTKKAGSSHLLQAENPVWVITF